MSIKTEIQSLIRTLQDQLANFEQVPEDRLEAFLETVMDDKDNYGDERLETRELQVMCLCLEADVRNQDNIGHCGNQVDYYWREGEWVHEDELPEGDEFVDEEV